MTSETVIRPIRLDDAPELTDVLRENRDFLSPWEPRRDDGYFTLETQTETLAHALDEAAQGRMLPLAIVDHSGALAGRITLTGITRGPFQSATMGYWVRRDRNGRGLATAAVRDVLRIAFADLGLHRVEAGTLVENGASKRVLARNGFQLYGFAPQYLQISGRWQDHDLYQRLTDEVDV